MSDVNLSFLEFLRWKDEYERHEKTRFVKKSGSRIREEGIRVGYYYCSRSGSYVSQSKGIKNPKKKGTAKTNVHCTASITCFELPDGKLEVKICSTHYGHDSELQHLRLTQTEKFQIVEQLCRGVPRDMVLDNVHASTGSELERIHLITMKDVKNIEKAYGIQASNNDKTLNMFDNLIIWITNIVNTENNPVLYFKEDGEMNTQNHHITLVLLTKGQTEVLKKYSNLGVFYLTTFVAKSKGYKYNHKYVPYIKGHTATYVTTLMLLDDLNEAVPVSFMITNDLNNDKYKILFSSLKKRVPEISAGTVFTDDNNDVYDLWCTTFEQTPLHLWINRHVDSDWRENLVTISDEELQVSVYENLYSFLESADANKLKSSLGIYVNELKSSVVTHKFGMYFSSKYIGTEAMWAGCFGKKSIGVNAQLNMEISCNELEEIAKKKTWDRNFLVRIVQHLLKTVIKKQCDRQTKLQRQVQELSTHHTLAVSIKPESVQQQSDTCWRVESAKDPANIFSLVTINYTTKCEDCPLSCAKCKVCAHQYVCTCKVYMFDRTMCKHIHAVIICEGNPEVFSLESEPAVDDSEKEAALHNMLLVSEMRRCKRGRKRKVPPETGAGDKMLQEIIEVLEEKEVIVKRKRGRPKRYINEQCVIKTVGKNEEAPENKPRRGRKPKREQDVHILNIEEVRNPVSDTKPPHRANILRKSKRLLNN